MLAKNTIEEIAKTKQTAARTTKRNMNTTNVYENESKIRRNKVQTNIKCNEMYWPLSLSATWYSLLASSLDLNSIFLVISIVRFNKITATYNGLCSMASSSVPLLLLGHSKMMEEKENSVQCTVDTFVEDIFLRFRIKFCYFNVISSETTRIIRNNLCENRMKVFADSFLCFFFSFFSISFLIWQRWCVFRCNENGIVSVRRSL